LATNASSSRAVATATGTQMASDMPRRTSCRVRWRTVAAGPAVWRALGQPEQRGDLEPVHRPSSPLPAGLPHSLVVADQPVPTNPLLNHV